MNPTMPAEYHCQTQAKAAKTTLGSYKDAQGF